ncbi:MAG TPA: hypothetical protein VGN11_08455, partial [Candidatus Baltobacteraceae bacterium]|nr:hypothetical protein [Candidatus Baltobacteraceae bacterium]
TLALVALALAYVAHQLVDRLPVHVPWWIEVPSFAVWFGVVNVAFDRWLWRIHVGNLRLSTVPDFAGSWHGTIAAMTADAERSDMPVDVRIRQTWSSIEVRGKTSRGVTRSKLAGVHIEDEELRYEYETQPDVFNPKAKHHQGFCVLELHDRDLLEGFYYTLGGTSTKGLIELRRKPHARPVSEHALHRRGRKA